MLKLKAAAVIGLTYGISALAMPAFDGVYTCTGNNGQTAQVTFNTSTGLLVITGMDTGATSSQGLPCANTNQTESNNGETISVAETCTASELSVEIKASGPGESDDIKMDFSIPSANVLTVAISGSNNGQDISATANCTKNN